MELRRIFPFALNVTDLRSLLISVAIHLIIGVIGGVLVKIISIVPLIGTIVGTTASISRSEAVWGLIWISANPGERGSTPARQRGMMLAGAAPQAWFQSWFGL